MDISPAIKYLLWHCFIESKMATYLPTYVPTHNISSLTDIFIASSLITNLINFDISLQILVWVSTKRNMITQSNNFINKYLMYLRREPMSNSGGYRSRTFIMRHWFLDNLQTLSQLWFRYCNCQGCDSRHCIAVVIITCMNKNNLLLLYFLHFFFQV